MAYESSKTASNRQTYYSIVKTDKNINSIPDKVENRIIITKYGKVYFDYSDSERIELNSDNKPYLTSHNFSDKSLNSNVILKYDEITESNSLSSIESIIIPSLVFDESGNTAIIVEKDDKTKKCKALIVSLVTDYLNKNFAENTNNEIVGSFIVTSCCDSLDETGENDKTQLEVTKLNVLTNETYKQITKLLGLNGIRIKTNLCKCDLEDGNVSASELAISLQVSQKSDNIVTITEDGIFVPAVSSKVYSKEEIDKLLVQISKTRFDGPYETLEDVPKPYYYDTYYLIGTEFPYMIYVRINCEWVLVGTTGIAGKDHYYTKSEIDELLKEVDEKIAQTNLVYTG